LFGIFFETSGSVTAVDLELYNFFSGQWSSLFYHTCILEDTIGFAQLRHYIMVNVQQFWKSCPENIIMSFALWRHLYAQLRHYTMVNVLQFWKSCPENIIMSFALWRLTYMVV